MTFESETVAVLCFYPALRLSPVSGIGRRMRPVVDFLLSMWHANVFLCY